MLVEYPPEEELLVPRELDPDCGQYAEQEEHYAPDREGTRDVSSDMVIQWNHASPPQGRYCFVLTKTKPGYFSCI